jgi:hypothetical protein
MNIVNDTKILNNIDSIVLYAIDELLVLTGAIF